MPELNSETVIENWIKPPKLVKYTNSVLESYDGEKLICKFNFPEKYSNNPFYIDNKKILEKGEMFLGKRTFYKDRFYALLEYYSIDNRLTAYYLDITLPCILKKNEVFIVDLKIDFWVMPDKKTFIILDQNELDEAIEKKLFSKVEIDVCNMTKESIKNFLKTDRFDEIFTDFKTSSYKNWDRYKGFYGC